MTETFVYDGEGADDVSLVTLAGPGGCVKSRLGIQIALELRDRFADGVYL